MRLVLGEDLGHRLFLWIGDDAPHKAEFLLIIGHQEQLVIAVEAHQLAHRRLRLDGAEIGGGEDAGEEVLAQREVLQAPLFFHG